MLSMNQLSRTERAAVLKQLCEGSSIRVTSRVTGNSRNTVTKLMLDAAEACQRYADERLRDLPCKRVQVDEAWAFCYAKAKNVPADKRGMWGFGDVWTFVAICADTKLVPSWLVGSRDAGCATELMQDLAGRLRERVQLTTDGHLMYLPAVEEGFAGAVDYAMLQKIYSGGPTDAEHRYSPAKYLRMERRAIQGSPDPKHVSTSYVERLNLTLRTSVRRFTRLTNGFSKKVENHAAAVALHFFVYNFARPHGSLKGKTPAQAAGVESRRWSYEDVAALLENPKS